MLLRTLPGMEVPILIAENEPRAGPYKKKESDGHLIDGEGSFSQRQKTDVCCS